jgi:predicted phosphodiesterase
VKTDGIFDYRVVDINAKYGQPINLFFYGDVHWNNPGFARGKWEQDIEDMKLACKRGPTFFIHTGDIFEAMSTSERRSYVSGELHDSNRTRWEQAYLEEIQDYLGHVKFMAGKTLAVYGGNHFFSFYDGSTSDRILAKALNAPYIGCSGYLILNLKTDKHHSHTVKIFVHHGLGSGRGAGSTFNALDKAASYFPDADIICMGHDHQAGAMHLPTIKCDQGQGGHWKIKEHQRIIGRSGSYLKAYEPGKKSYAVDAMYRPSTLGCLQVVVTPRRQQLGPKESRNDERWVQVKAVI